MIFMKRKIVFLCSGNGGNLKFIHKCIQYNILQDYEISSVITDRECGALDYAKANGIPFYKIKYNRDYNEELMYLLIQSDPDFIITNFHKIIDLDIVQKFDRRLINLHYSLLPAFKGLIGDKPVKMALEKNCKFVGTTVHYVDVEVDNGEIIAQSVIPVNCGETFEQIMNRVFRSGCLNLLNSFFIVRNDESIDFQRCSVNEMFFSPGIKQNIDLNDIEKIWDEL